MGEVTHGADHRWQGIWEHGCMDAMLTLGSKDRNIRAILGAWRVEARLGTARRGCGHGPGSADAHQVGGMGMRVGVLV